MKIREIDKARYRKNLRVVFAAITVALMILAVLFSTLFIHLFSTPDVSHFMHNLAGVAAAAAAVAYVLNKSRGHDFMIEVVYVWDLKQQLNRIYRKQHKVEAAVENNNHDAMMVMNFMYRGSKQLYLLDDNTITIDNLVGKIQNLEKRLQAAGLPLTTDSYKTSMLAQF